MIKFNIHNVVNTETGAKARISYSLNNHISGKPVVTLYSKDYSRDLGKLFPDEYVNDTDSQTDYFDQGRVRLFEGHPLYAAALEAANRRNAAWDARHQKRIAKKKTCPTCLDSACETKSTACGR